MGPEKPKVALFDLSVFDDGVDLASQLQTGKYDAAVHSPLMGKFVHMDACRATSRPPSPRAAPLGPGA